MVIMGVFVSILSGCGGGGGGSFTEPGATVSATVPANAAAVVSVGNKLTVTFSEAMDPASINSTTFVVKQGATVVPGTVTYSGVTAIFTPTSNFAASTVYTATITTGAKTLAGKALSSDYVWNFTTGTTTDTTLPTVNATVPVTAATGVATNGAITATFSEPMDPETIVLPATFTVKRGATVVPGTVTYSGVTAVFTPTSIPLAAGTYTATITTAAKDLGGNALAVNKVWSFTTTGAAADIIAPTVVSTLPLNAATLVSVNNKPAVTFSEPMIALTTATLSMKETVLGTNVPGTVAYAGTTATFSPSNPLAFNTDYTVTVKNGATDLALNALVVPATSGTPNPWTFRTELTPVPLPLNPTAPTLGETARFVILGSQAITTTGVTAISNGDIGIFDLARSNYAGFTTGAIQGHFDELTNGVSFAHDDMPPFVIPAPYASTIAFINQVRTDLQTADTFLGADPNPGAATQVCPIQLGGQVLTRGVYKTAANVQITTGPLHLDAQGDPNSIFIFSIGGTLTTGAPGGSIILDGGALAKNVFFRTGGITTIGAGTIFYGNVFAASQINVNSGADITGRFFALTDRVTLIANKVTKAP